MNKEEALEVLCIMVTADGSCPSCGRDLISSFLEKFPEFEDEANKAWEEKHLYLLREE